jgi:hypothetical protein
VRAAWLGAFVVAGCGSHAVELLPDGVGCAQPVALTNVPSNLLVLVDRSASMNQRFGQTPSRWDALHTALVDVANEYQTRVRFGVALYPGMDQACNVGGNCQQGHVFADLPATPADIDQTMANAKRCSNFGTPTDAALGALVDYGPLHDDLHANYVLLITDGKSSCKDPSGSAAVLQMQTWDIRTFVLGFGANVDRTELASTATAGRTALPDMPYYQVDDETALTNALASVASRARSCTYALATTPFAPQQLVVRIDGKVTSNWTIDPATNEVRLLGESCNAVRANAEATVTVSDCSTIE